MSLPLSSWSWKCDVWSWELWAAILCPPHATGSWEIYSSRERKEAERSRDIPEHPQFLLAPVLTAPGSDSPCSLSYISALRFWDALYLLSSIPSFCLSQLVVRLLLLETQSPNIVTNKQIHWSLTVLCFHTCSLDLHSQDKLSFTGPCQQQHILLFHTSESHSLQNLSLPLSPEPIPAFLGFSFLSVLEWNANKETQRGWEYNLYMPEAYEQIMGSLAQISQDLWYKGIANKKA